MGQSGPGSNGNEGVLRIPQSPSITGTSLSDYLVSYPGHSLGGGSAVGVTRKSYGKTFPGKLEWVPHLTTNNPL